MFSPSDYPLNNVPWDWDKPLRELAMSPGISPGISDVPWDGNGLAKRRFIRFIIVRLHRMDPLREREGATMSNHLSPPAAVPQSGVTRVLVVAVFLRL